MKRLRAGIAGAAFWLSFAQASVLVNQPSPYPQHVLGDTTYGIFYGGSTTGTLQPNTFYDAAHGYRFLNITKTDSANTVWLDMSTDQNFALTAGQSVLVTLSTTQASQGNEISLRGAGVVSGNIAPPDCNTTGTTSCPGTRGPVPNLSAVFSPGNTLRVSFSILDLCQTPNVPTGPGSLCGASGSINTINQNTLTTQIFVNFTVRGVVTGTPTPTPAPAASFSFNLTVSDLAPVIDCPGSGKIEDFYFPGDSQIFFTPSKFFPSPGPMPALANLQVGMPVQSVVLLANRGGVPNSTPGMNALPPSETVSYFSVGTGRQTVSGFQNIEATASGYNGAVYAENAGGIISQDSQSCKTFPDTIKPRPVLGVLTESKCFIATAAYHDGRARPVMMLREFRDEVLSQSSIGRKFIQTYYRYSPALAEWAWDKPWVRSVALRALAPIELFAWAVLKFSHAEETSAQPYLDQVKKKIDETHPEPTPSPESYLESVKRGLGPEPTPSDESYTDHLKKKLGSAENAAGFTEKEKTKLPEETKRENPIEAVQGRRDHKPTPERGPIKNAVGFKLGINPGVKVINSNNANVTFPQVYGGPWQPDLVFHYERQMFHSENYGSIALSADLGFGYSEGFGQLAYGFGSINSSQSFTKFRFLQLPIILGSYYRFNLFRMVRPYVGGGFGSMQYMELRSDDRGGKKGFTPLYSASLGASLLLDFFDSSTALDSYLSSGIQHTYLFLEYTRLNTFNQTGVTFARNGLYSGFLFEF